MKKSLLGLALASALLAAGAAHADNAQGPYVGGGIGFTHHTVKDSGKLDYDTNNFSYGIYGGYRFNEHVAVEVGYTRLGDLKVATRAGDFTAKNSQTSLSVLGYTPAYYGFQGFGRLGVAKTELSAFGHDFSQSGVVVGIGVEKALTPSLGLRIETQYTDKAGIDDLRAVSVNTGLKYAF